MFDHALQSRIKDAERFAELRFEWRNAVPAEHEFGGVVQEFGQGFAGVNAPAASPIVSTTRLCWTTDSGCSHRDAPPHRIVGERPAARSSSVQAPGSD